MGVRSCRRGSNDSEIGTYILLDVVLACSDSTATHLHAELRGRIVDSPRGKVDGVVTWSGGGDGVVYAWLGLGVGVGDAARLRLWVEGLRESWLGGRGAGVALVALGGDGRGGGLGDVGGVGGDGVLQRGRAATVEGHDDEQTRGHGEESRGDGEERQGDDEERRGVVHVTGASE